MTVLQVWDGLAAIVGSSLVGVTLFPVYLFLLLRWVENKPPVAANSHYGPRLQPGHMKSGCAAPPQPTIHAISGSSGENTFPTQKHTEQATRPAHHYHLRGNFNGQNLYIFDPDSPPTSPVIATHNGISETSFSSAFSTGHVNLPK